MRVDFLNLIIRYTLLFFCKILISEYCLAKTIFFFSVAIELLLFHWSIRFDLDLFWVLSFSKAEIVTKQHPINWVIHQLSIHGDIKDLVGL